MDAVVDAAEVSIEKTLPIEFPTLTSVSIHCEEFSIKSLSKAILFFWKRMRQVDPPNAK